MSEPTSAHGSNNPPDTVRGRERGPVRQRDGGTYTGVVVIHGLGIEQRNDTLQEALNALTYWFNHIAGLQYRPTGPGRIWVETRLTDDTDPDAPQSSATITLQAPDAQHPLRLEMKEVWWAQSFGQPSVAHVLWWSLMQFFQVLNRLLLINLDPTKPPRVGHRDDHQNGADPQGFFGNDTTRKRDNPLWILLKALLAIYDNLQYVLNFVAMLLGLGTVWTLLVLAVILDKLTWIPGMPSILQGVQSIIALLSLHWLGAMEVYMEDYTMAATVRQRFQCELETFLNDERCERIVAIAHSMGTVIAYEGLWTALEVADERLRRKPITFVCLAPALSRLWRVARTEPHRLRIQPLSENVEWHEFWARFDPVPAGPLIPQSLPRAHDWDDKYRDEPTASIRAQLRDKCMHIGVINRDNILFDHTSYWENLEQVVGPIARMLVAGNEALVEHVERRLATSHDVLRRRARVAAQASVALALGAVTLYVLIFTNQVWSWIEQSFIVRLLISIRSEIGDALNSVFAPIGAFFAQVGADILLASQGSGVGAMLASLLEYVWQNACRWLFAFTVAGLVVMLVSMLLHRSPQRYHTSRARPVIPGRY